MHFQLKIGLVGSDGAHVPPHKSLLGTYHDAIGSGAGIVCAGIQRHVGINTL